MRKNLFLLVLLAGAFAQAAQSADPARRGYVSSATRDARLANYYNGYARRIECVGNKAYPPVAKGQTLQVVATASVRADGMLENAVLERASGSAELDAAVLAMIRAGAPYAAFPPALKSRYAALDLVATWTFGPVNAREPGPPTDC
jgi:protein TonB